MVSNTVAAIVLIIYVLLSGFLIYFCAIADPNTSRGAYWVTVELPDKLWALMTKILSPKSLDSLSVLTDRALVVLYLGVVLGSWSIVFWYIYPWIIVSSHVSNFHMALGVAVFVACLSSWRLASKSHPGTITARSYQRYNHYPYDNLLFVPNQMCKSTNLLRIARSKFDRLRYHQNVPRYDHFCGWVYNTIGEENYRWFLLFLAVHVGMCVYGAIVTYWLFVGDIKDAGLFDHQLFDRLTGETFAPTKFIIVQYYFARRMPECSLLTIMVTMGTALGAFLGYHIHLTNCNMTTNEHGKWQDVKAWYKKKKKAYDKAVKEGLVNPKEKESNELANDDKEAALSVAMPLVDDDKNVTCTPSLTKAGDSMGTESSSAPSPSQTVQKSTQDPEYIDPGPTPKNLYNRGLIENWKEVIFPLSLRKNAEQQPYTLPIPAEVLEFLQQEQQKHQPKRPSKGGRRAKGT